MTRRLVSRLGLLFLALAVVACGAARGSAAPTLLETISPTPADLPGPSDIPATLGEPSPAAFPSQAPAPTEPAAAPTPAAPSVGATPHPTKRPATPNPTCVVGACTATANPNPTPGGNWTITVTVPSQIPLGTAGMDYHVHISGTVVCSGCDPYDVTCFVELQWPGTASTNKYNLNETAGAFTANQTWREPSISYGLGTWHWYFHCRTSSGSVYAQRDDEGTFEVVVPPS